MFIASCVYGQRPLCREGVGGEGRGEVGMKQPGRHTRMERKCLLQVVSPVTVFCWENVEVCGWGDFLGEGKSGGGGEGGGGGRHWWVHGVLWSFLSDRHMRNGSTYSAAYH